MNRQHYRRHTGLEVTERIVRAMVDMGRHPAPLDSPFRPDCTGASFIAQRLVQWRHNLHAGDRDVDIPQSAIRAVSDLP